MRRLVLAFAAAALSAGPAFANDWLLDRSASTVSFEATVFGNATSGSFEEFSAEITLDPENLAAARIEAVVVTSSGDMSTSDYETSLKSAQGLAPSNHPEARFISQDIRAAETGYEAHGVLTIKGVELDFVLPFTLEIEGERAVADARFLVDRNSFSVGGSGWGDVGAQVAVILHIEAALAE